ncbi:MAG: hypothetical protein STHCBS139747_002002 [Sporothrix thermara]
MCHLVTIFWSCGHTVEAFTACGNAVALEKGKVDEEADAKYAARGVYYRPCADVKVMSTPSPKYIPFCQYPSCIPNYWSCCRCRPLKQFGSLGGDECGDKRVSRQARLKRLAPTSTAENAARDLQLGDGVCGDDMEEELRAGYGQPPSVAAEPCPSSNVCRGCYTEEHANEQAISLDELHACIDEVQDMVPMLLGESRYNGETDCGHMRCDKCIRWRRCPCECLCANVIPSTRRNCNRCLLSRCEALELSGLCEHLEAMTAADTQT